MNRSVLDHTLANDTFMYQFIRYTCTTFAINSHFFDIYWVLVYIVSQQFSSKAHKDSLLQVPGKSVSSANVCGAPVEYTQPASMCN